MTWVLCKMLKFILSLFLLSCIPTHSFCQTNAPTKFVPPMQQLCKKVEQRPYKRPEDSEGEKLLKEPLLSIEKGIGYAETIKLMHNRNLNQKIKVSNNMNLYVSPIIYAVIVGNWPATKALLDMGADVNLELSSYSLEASIARNRFDFACQLLQHGAKLPMEKEKKLLFFNAVMIVESQYYQDSAIFIEYLLKNGFDVNDLGSTTPLIQSASLGNIPVVEVLLKYGADTHHKNSRGETALEIAKKYKRKDIVELLEKAEQRHTGQTF